MPCPPGTGLRALQRARRAMHGFTLAELMIVIAIVGILMALAVPNFRPFVLSQRIKNASFEVFASLILARNEAITRGATVTIASISGTNWAGGWTVTAFDGTLLRTQTAYPASITMTGPATLAYNGMGRLTGAAGTINLTASGIDASSSRCISIDLSGRPVTKSGTC